MGDGRKSWSELCQTQIPESPRRLGEGGSGALDAVLGLVVKVVSDSLLSL